MEPKQKPRPPAQGPFQEGAEKHKPAQGPQDAPLAWPALLGPMPWQPPLAGPGPALPLAPMPALPQRAGEQKTPNPFDGMYDDERGMCVAPLAGTGKLLPPPTKCESSKADDLALNPLRQALNDKSLSPGARAAMMLSYRDKQLARVDIGAMFKMQGNDPSYPVFGSGPNKGMHMPLYNQLGSNPKMQSLMSDLTDRILTADSKTLDIQAIFADTQKKAREMSGTDDNTADGNLMALQAMATLSNYYKARGPDGKLPPELASKIPPELWKKINDAGEALTNSESPNAAVMSHGVKAKPGGGNFTADHNFHFFSHAYLTASLIKNHGVSPHQAKAMSGFIGAQYELMDGSLKEGAGNSGIKDILMNAEGAGFGEALMQRPCASLPGQNDGPGVEDRSIPNLKDLPPDAKATAEDAADLSKSNLLLHLLGGSNGNKSDVDWKIYEDTGIPPMPSAGPHMMR